MDKELVLRKLESLQRCLDRIKEKTPVSLVELARDLDLQDIIVVNLERAVQVCVDIGSHIIAEGKVGTPGKMSEVFFLMAEMGILSSSVSEKMSKSVGFRNIAVHEYDNLDWDVVYSIVTRDLEVFKTFARAVMDRLDSQP